MGKQTNKSGSKFGGKWTKEKLHIIEDYLYFYVRALSKINVKLVYIDAFAGSGNVELEDGSLVDGSAIISLKYDFDRYYFIEIDTERINGLKRIITERYPEKSSKITIINENCNDSIINILSSLKKTERGVLFLDPYALELEWGVLEKAGATGILDVWYLFPLNALTRNLPNKKIPSNTSSKIDKVLGTHEWENALYKESLQISMFEEQQYERCDLTELVTFVNNRLASVFAYVSPKSRMLKNGKNSPLFILYFLMSNNSEKAVRLGSKVVSDIFDKIDLEGQNNDNN